MADGPLDSKPGEADRLSAAMQTVAAHLQDAMREIEPTREEWRAAIAWLTAVGQITDQKRQEWILLSDVLGVSALVDAVNARRDPSGTPNTVLGPFYVADAPARENGETICATRGGEPLHVAATVRDGAGAPIPGARLEVWQANQDGFYENQRPDEQPEHNLRGVFHADAEGRAWWRTVKPCGYALPADGPVGALMTALGRDLRRPAHFHLLVAAPGFETLTTHIFDAADPLIGDDALFAVRDGLARAFVFEQTPDGPAWRVDIALSLVPTRRL